MKNAIILQSAALSARKYPRTATEILDSLISIGDLVAGELVMNPLERLRRWPVCNDAIPGEQFNTTVYRHVVARGLVRPERDYVHQPYWSYATYHPGPVQSELRDLLFRSMCPVGDLREGEIGTVTFHINYVLSQSEDHYWIGPGNPWKDLGIPDWLGERGRRILELAARANGKHNAVTTGEQIVSELSKERVTTNPVTLLVNQEDVFAYKGRFFTLQRANGAGWHDDPRHVIGMGVYNKLTFDPLGYVLFGKKQQESLASLVQPAGLLTIS